MRLAIVADSGEPRYDEALKRSLQKIKLTTLMKIAILSRKSVLYSTTRLKQAAADRGHAVRVIDHMQCNLIMEKGKPKIQYRGEILPKFDAIIPRVGASVTYYGAAVIRQFEMMNVYTPVTSSALLRSRDKLRCLQNLSRAGLGLPRTVFTNFSKNADDIVKLAGGAPLIIKLLEGTQGLGVVLAETHSAATSVVEAFHDLKAKVIVQEFIEEAKGADIRAFVVGGKVVGAMKRQAKEGEFRSNLHRGGSSKVIELSKIENTSAILAANVIGLGIAGVDMLESKQGPMIIEVNSSPGLEGIEGATGVDIAGAIIEYLEESVKKKKRTNRKRKKTT